MAIKAMIIMINKVFVIAAEPSGDELGAEFIEALRGLSPKIEIAGVGLEKMARIGVKSDIDLSALSILGYVEALKVWKTAREKAKETAKLAADFNPEAVVLIDSWGFSLRAAAEIRKLCPNTRLIKMVGPQVWATRKGRAKVLAKHFDEIWCIHEFEAPFYDGLGIKVGIIGNPALARAIKGDGATFRKIHNLNSQPLIGILPGSRRKEISRILPDFVAAGNILNAKYPNLKFLTVAAGAVKEAILSFKSQANFDWIIADEIEKANGFAAMDFAIACSGTVTSELAVAGVPFVVGYRLDDLTFLIIRKLLLKSKYVSLVNVAQNREIVPELLQWDLKPETIASLIENWIENPNEAQKTRDDLKISLQKMGFGSEPSAIRAAKLLLK